MLKIAKNSHWLQTKVVQLVTSYHPMIGHNIGKIRALQKAFYLVNLDRVPGDYVEFGMYEGTSFIAAYESDKRSRIAPAPTRAFWGYDSFGGFKYSSEADAHPFYVEGDFKSSYEKTRKRIARHFRDKAKWTITPGWVEDTILGRTPSEIGIKKVAVAFIDLDLGRPAAIALDFLRPALQPGSIIILDDYFSYRGSMTRGVAGAFAEFCRKNPELHFRRVLDYGFVGQGFMLSENDDDPPP